jgi:hypothetical protein
MFVKAAALLSALLLTAPAAPAQGPQNRDQVARVNLARCHLAAPAARLYGLAVMHCGTSVPETELVARAAALAGQTHVFGLVVVDPSLYFEDPRFRRRIDDAFERVREATREIEAIQPAIPPETWKPLVPSWNEFHEGYDAIAGYWTDETPEARRLVGIELEAASATTRVGEPVQLTVTARFRDGGRDAVSSMEVGWLLRPDRGVTINSAHQFLAHESGIFQVTAIYKELTSRALAIRVEPRPRALERVDLTGDFLGHRQEFGLVKAVPCKVPDRAFNAIRIRILEHPARIGDVKVYFADGSAQVFWRDRRELLEPGEYLIGSFVGKRKILRFDLRSQGDGGFHSRLAIIGVSHRE